MAYGLVWKGDRVVVPRDLRKEMLGKIHYNHMGLEKSRLRARESVFWPGINNDIQNIISNCNVCLSHRRNDQKEEMQPHEIPNRPWAKFGADLFQVKHDNFLLLVDYYSKFFEIVELSHTTSEDIITCLKNIFSRQGIPEYVMSDNGPQFSSSVFRQFALEWDFNHVTSSPRYPQSNGQVERTVQTIKSIIIKAQESGADYRLALLEYLNTPLEKDMPSPAELLQSRKLRGILPFSQKQLKPKIHKNIHKQLLNRQQIQKRYYDRNARNLRPLQIGEKVRVLDLIKKRWIPGTITSILKDRSFEIKLKSGKKIVRNRRHIVQDSPSRQDTCDYRLEYDDIDVFRNNVPLLINMLLVPAGQ